MAKVQVKVTKMAYFDHKRHREGTVILMDESQIKFDNKGKVVSPKWIELVDEVKPKGKKQVQVVVEETPEKIDEVI